MDTWHNLAKEFDAIEDHALVLQANARMNDCKEPIEIDNTGEHTLEEWEAKPGTNYARISRPGYDNLLRARRMLIANEQTVIHKHLTNDLVE